MKQFSNLSGTDAKRQVLSAMRDVLATFKNIYEAKANNGGSPDDVEFSRGRLEGFQNAIQDTGLQ